MSGFEVYLILMLGKVVGICVAITVTAGVGALIFGVSGVAGGGSQEENDWDLKFTKRFLLPIFLVFLILSLTIPTTKQAALIYVIPKILNNENAQQIPDNLAKFANEELKSYVKEWASDGKKK